MRMSGGDPMADQRLRAGVIGCGGISNSHTKALSLMPEVNLVAVSDIDESRARAFVEQYGAEHAYTNVDEMLARDDIDFVVNATANNLHAPLSIKALEAGKHVLVQKPMALTLVEADAMIAAEKRSGKKLMVSFFEFFHPAFKRAKELVDRGAIGDVFFVKAIMAWYTPSTDVWRFDPKISGGGILMDGHVHHVAYFLHLLGDPVVESVYSEHGTLNSDARVEDTGVTLIRTSRAIGEISGSNRVLEPNAQNGRLFKEWIEISGSKGTIHIRPTERPSLRVFLNDGELPEDLSGGWIAPRLEWVPFHERGRSAHFNPEEDPWVGEHRHFVECIREDKPVISNGQFGRNVLEVLMAGYQSGRERRAIPLPLAAVAR
ncbi:MAG: Gfo/Idh/MocA family oxidoreductase [Chloroflexota bacterium]|nr:MAG: Gfo/Idh/MocA family oxidoreductase [Chloroflexota bacterium]